MPYIRRISAADAVDAGYRATKSSWWRAPRARPCWRAFSATAGTRRRQVQAGEVIYIPAGLPHGSDNQSGAAERHLEILIPAVEPGTPFLKPVRNVDEVQLPAAAPHVASSSGQPAGVTGHETRWVLTDESTGGRTARVTAVERTGPEDPGTSASRDDDRLIVVTQGELTAEIGTRPAAVPAQAVIVIPAGVPHRIWNPSSSPVHCLDAEVPAPAAYAKLAQLSSTPVRTPHGAPVCAHESVGIRGKWLPLTARSAAQQAASSSDLAPGDLEGSAWSRGRQYDIAR